MICSAVHSSVLQGCRKRGQYLLHTEDDAVDVNTNVGTKGAVIITPFTPDQPGEASQTEPYDPLEVHTKFQ